MQSHRIGVRVVDSAAHVAESYFDVAVSNVNEAPLTPTFDGVASLSESAEVGHIVGVFQAVDPDRGDSVTYSLLDNAGGRFEIDPTTGQITLLRANLDHETSPQLSVRVRATDSGGLSAESILAIEVTDEEEAPTAIRLISGGEVDLSAEGAPVAVFEATDPDRGDSLSFSLADDAAGRFKIDPITGVVTVADPTLFVNATVDSYPITVKVTDTAGLTYEETFSLKVTAFNDAPYALRIFSGGSLSETAAAGAIVAVMTATDPDPGDTLTYRLLDNANGRFVIDPTSGVIQVASGAVFDFEAAASHAVRVEVSDAGGLTATATVTLNVTNVNERPVVRAVATQTFVENATGPIFNVDAIDPDAGTTLAYSLSGADAGLFEVSATGAVRFRASPNFEAPGDAGSDNRYDIIVTASDGTLSASKDFQIGVTNVNEAPRLTSDGAASVVENSAGETVVATVTAVDDDAGDVLIYQLVNDAGGRFRIDSATGIITVAPDAVLDYESQPSHILQVRVRDSLGATAVADLTVSLTDGNEFPVISSAASASIAENAAGVVYTVTATDADPDQTLTYNLEGQDSDHFTIDAVSGAVSFRATPDFETPSDLGADNVYSVVVTASDGELTSRRAVDIRVTDVNEAPGPATFISGGSVAENSAGGAVVGTVRAIDRDAGDTVSYSMVDSAGGRFAINAAGALTVASGAVFDRESSPTHSVVVRATDRAGLSQDTTLTIQVSDVNEAPGPAQWVSGGAIAENAAPGDVIGRVAAVDVDQGQTLTYALADNAGGRFTIDAASGEIRLAMGQSLDFETSNAHPIRVRVTDPGGLTSNVDLTIHIGNVNEAPTITSGANAAFAENADGIAYQTTARDPDVGTVLSYALSGADAALFEVDSNGAVRFRAAPNFEAPADSNGDNGYVLTVTANDGTLTASQAVTITVNDVNERPVITSGASAVFAENATSIVYTGVATDPDANTSLTWSLSGADAQRFTIDANGNVRFIEAPDFETRRDADADGVYDIVVNVSDGTLSDARAVAVTVSDMSEAPGPALWTSGGTIAENSPANSLIGVVTASDLDSGGPLTYALIGNPGNMFRIDQSNGEIRLETGASLNFEAVNSHLIRIRTTDSDGLSSEADLVVSVSDVNERPSITSPASATVAENVGGGIYTATASDPDATTRLTYSISGADAARFDIDATNGVLTFLAPPNYEAPTDAGANNVYDITITASDGALSDSRALAVTVTNVNEAPSAVAFASGGTIVENSATGALVGVLAASDPDANSTLTYTLIDNPGGLFSVGPLNGELRVASGAVLDFEAGATRTIMVRVNDAAGLAQDTSLTVTLSNVNEAPSIATWTSGGVIAENSGAGASVGFVRANDPDATDATLTYSLVDNAGGRFTITPNGEVRVIGGLNFEETTGHTIRVRATDSGGLTTDTDLAVTITNVNEAPVIVSGATANVNENATGPAYQISATDVDSGTTLTYSITGADAGRFSVNAATGLVSFITPPNHESPTDANGDNAYELTVVASDGTLTAERAVQVNVIDVNEAPVFTSGGTASWNENAIGVVYQAVVVDDEVGNVFAYSLSGDDATLFQVDSTGAVRFRTPPNFEAPRDDGSDNAYDITVHATDGVQSASQGVLISVLDVNEAPVSLSLTSGGSVNENAIAGVSVGTMSASDPDAGDLLTYSLVTGASRFAIDSASGQITVAANANLNFEQQSAHIVRVRVTDSEGLFRETDITVALNDVNDAPVVTSPASVPFDEYSVGIAYQATATDEDASSEITYGLSGTDATLFTIDQASGAVRFVAPPNFAAPLDSGADNVYDLVVVASDGITIGQRAVQVTVVNVNEAPIVNSIGTLTVNENVTGAIYTVTGSDPDPGTRLIFSVGGADAQRFNINSDTGALSFRTLPNYEIPADVGGDNVYDITVTASDGLLSDSKGLSITVLGINEAPSLPQWQTTGTVSEHAGAGVIVGRVVATDPDAGDAVSYELRSTAGGRFAINATNGDITVVGNGALDFELNATHTIRVRATDNSGAFIDTDLTIAVVNENEPPQIVSATFVTRNENYQGVAYQIEAVDGDPGAQLTYSISGTDAGRFSVNAATGAVRFVTSPDHENPDDANSDNTYVFTVAVTDGEFGDSQAVTLGVNNVNEAPTVTSATSVTIVENAAGVIYTATAVDQDPGASFFFELGGPDKDLFDIDPQSGQVFLRAPANFENPADANRDNTYVVDIIANDGQLRGTRTLSVVVQDVNEAPGLASWQNGGGGILETAGANALVGVVRAVDPDAGDVVTYSLIDDAGGRFTINAANGEVRLTGAGLLDAETVTQHAIKVRATDPDGAARDTDLVVTVLNENEAPVITSGSTASFDENAVGVVYDAEANDQDAGDVLRFSIVGDDAGFFDIDAVSGIVTFKAPPNFEARADANGDNVYSLIVRVSDGALLGSQVLSVTLRDINEAPSFSSPTTVNFAENGTGPAYTTVATDPDADDSLIYTLSGADAGLFEIDADGVVTFKAAPNFEMPADIAPGNSYNLTITANDGEFAVSRAIVISVTDVNEAPSLSTWQGAAAIPENSASGVVVSTVVSTDVDVGDFIRFSLANNDGGRFVIDPVSGQVTVAAGADLNFESSVTREIIVRATDSRGLSSDATLQITLTNVNEAPSAATWQSGGTIAENSAASSVVGRVQSSDPDASPTLTYSLTSNPGSRFTIDAATGEIRLAGSVDFETAQSHVVVVRTTDQDNLSADATLTISVTNVNEAPVVTSGAGGIVAENTAGAIYTVSATDVDAGTTLTYALSGADAAHFSIDAVSGAVRFAPAANFEAPLDAGTDNVYDLTVSASDGQLVGTRLVAITVTNVNEAPNAPAWQSGGTIAENSA
ncbi:MAG: cadherin domain-containing protein, partial [Caulobacterales bacterium]